MANHSKKTILTRPGGTWSDEESDRLSAGLHTEATRYPNMPEKIFLPIGYTRDEVEAALGSANFEHELQDKGW